MPCFAIYFLKKKEPQLVTDKSAIDSHGQILLHSNFCQNKKKTETQYVNLTRVVCVKTPEHKCAYSTVEWATVNIVGFEISSTLEMVRMTRDREWWVCVEFGGNGNGICHARGKAFFFWINWIFVVRVGFAACMTLAEPLQCNAGTRVEGQTMQDGSYNICCWLTVFSHKQTVEIGDYMCVLNNRTLKNRVRQL